MSIYTKAATVREIYLMTAAIARGNRQATMRTARLSNTPASLKRTLVGCARDWNRDVVSNLVRAREMVSGS